MDVAAQAGERDTRTLLWLWGAMLAGPIAWAFDQGAGYAFVKPACVGEDTPGLWLITAVAVLIAAGGGYTAWRFRQIFRAQTEARDADERNLFLATVALAFNVLIVLLILTAAIPQFVLSPCE